ncbi:hypothetical protein KKA15_02895 [Patescibacteria group bacterium]|nr:hypothetical protein [Patescibacteria group bacterium]
MKAINYFNTKKITLLIILLLMTVLIGGCKHNTKTNGVTPTTNDTKPSTQVSTKAPADAPQDAPVVHLGETNWPSEIGFLVAGDKTNSAAYIRGKSYECFKEDGYVVYCESKPSTKCNSGDVYCEDVGRYMYCQNNQWRSYIESKCTESEIIKDWGIVCSNDNYSAIWSDKSSNIYLDEASQAKLDAAVKAQGNTALAGIADLTCLTSLNLNNLDLFNPVTITDISALTNLTNLKTLYIGNHDITDVAPLIKLKRLTNLSIANNPITDISQLADLPNLVNVNVDRIDADTSDNNCDRLKNILPEIKVDC